MIFRCYTCRKYKMWNSKKCYQVIVTSNDGDEELFTRKICKPCGDQINNVYESGKKIAEMDPNGEEDNYS